MGTFGSIGTVRLGIYAAQKGLDVTGNNITNINTEGYTRQRLNQVSLIPGAADRYFSSYKTRIGQGAVVAGVDQLRDPGLDISYRKSVADVGSANAKLTGLNDLAVILDEVGKGDLDQDDGVILSQLNDLRDLINQAITNGVGTYNSLIRESASSLAKLFNSYATKLSDLQKTYEDKLDQQVTEVNDILKNIQDLNVAIRNSDIRGDEALELRDQRNLLLDQLNEYVKVDVKYSTENIGADTRIEKLTVSIASNEGHTHTLIDGVYGTKLDYDAADNYKISISDLTDPNGKEHPKNDDLGAGIEMVDNDLYGSLQSLRELLTEKGEYATSADSLAQLKTDYESQLNKEAENINTILGQIQQLNQDITAATTSAEDKAEKTAERDALVTQLKNYVNVDVTDGSNGLIISLTGPNKTALLDSNNTPATLSVGTAADKYSLSVNGTQLGEGEVSGSIQYLRNELNTWPEKADTEVDADASTKRGIPYYQMALDNLARTFAEEMNALNNTGLTGAGNLFSMGSNTDAATGVDPVTGEPLHITAANIAVSYSWANDKVSIQATADANAPSGDTSRLAEFLNLFNREDIAFTTDSINPGAAGDPYTGSFEDMLLRIQSTLAEDQMTTDAVLNNYLITTDDIYVDREGVMGVDLNDEATSLMTYQKAYSAACRLMTTLETALDALLAM